ncbi:MAG: sulfatase [Clostridiales bacterium]|nr:sulfatase [Clostridiales bacterium]
MSQPNIIFIMTDDHASHAMSCYGSKINKTPNMDRIANEGIKFDNCFCTNSICAPSRATILTGTHTHINGVKTLGDKLDNTLNNFPKMFQKAGYQTAIVGKWHLGQGEKHWPSGFNHFNVLPGQGDYFDPVMVENGVEKVFKGYVTDIITDKSLEWLEKRDQEKPFLLLCHHKAPHRPWNVHERYADHYSEDIPVPLTFDDDYKNRSQAAFRATMRVERDFNSLDLKIKLPDGYEEFDSFPIPEDISTLQYETNEGDIVTFKSKKELKNWKYQRYMKEYLRCIDCVDDNIGRILEYLDDNNLTKNTMVVYTSDQGFYLGDHGWYDKRFMYEHSLRMPFVVRYPKMIKPGTISDQMILNLDFAQTFLDLAGIAKDPIMQGKSFINILDGSLKETLREDMYYRYWMHLADHNVAAHYGVRTKRYKLIYYYGKALGTLGSIDTDTPEEWELFDLKNDPNEMKSLYNDIKYADIREKLRKRLYELKNEAKDFE